MTIRMMGRIPGGTRRMILILLFLPTSFLCSLTAGYASQPNLLILDSYHQGFRWSDDERTGFLSRLREVYPDSDPPIEHFDAKRFPEQNDLVRTKDYLVGKYRNRRFGLLVAFDNPALDTALRYRKELFPGVPIVFAGINNYQPSMIAGHTKVTGVAEDLDMVGGLRIALKLHPKAKEVLIIHDYTMTGLTVRREFESILPEFQGKIKVRFTPPATFDEVLALMKSMPPDGLALILSFVTDRSGYSPTQAEAVRFLTSQVSIPVYALHEIRLGHGIVGGMLLSGKEQGRRAGDIALRVLDGEDPSKIPVDTQSTALPMFDYRQLVRFNIPLSALPKGSIIVNRPESFYEKHKTLAFGTLAVLVLLSVMVAVLTGAILRRRRAEKEARAKEDQFRTLFDNAGDAIFIVDLQGHFLEVNRLACERLGYGYEEFLKMGNKEVNSPEYAPLIPDRIKAIRQQGYGIFETTHIRKDGKSIPTEISCRIIRYGDQPAILTIARDITERKRAEEALRENEEQYRSLFETSTNAILIRNREGVMTMVNEAAISLLGATKADDLIGRAYLDFVYPEDRALSAERVERIFRIAIEQPKPYQDETKAILPREHRIVQMNGDVIYVESTAVAFHHKGELFIQGIFRNITERKRGEEALKRSEEEAKRLAQENAIVAEIGRIISSTLNLEEAYERFAGEVRKLIPFDGIAINIINHGEGTITVPYVSGVSLPGCQPGDVLPLAGSVTGEVMRTRSSLVIQRGDKNEQAQFPTLSTAWEMGLQSLVVVPLISKDRVIGAIHFRSAESNTYSDRDLKLAETIGSQIAGAVDNAQLFNERKRAEEALQRSEEQARLLAQENAIVAEIGRIVSSTLNISEVYEHFAEQVRKLISFDRININLIDHETRTAISAYSSGKGVKGRQIGDVYLLEGTAMDELIRTHSGLVLHPDDQVELERRFPGLVPSFQAGHRSMMVVPLISKGNVIAGLYFGSTKCHFFNDRDLRLAELIGAQIAGAIANAQLFTERERLEERLRRAEKMEALGTLAGGVAHDLNNVLGVLVGYSELLLMEIREGSPLRKHVSNILQSGQRAAAIIQDLLTLARRGVAVSEVINLNDVISDYFRTPEFEKLKTYHPRVTFKTTFDKDLMNVKGSPVHLGKTIMNLLSNAAEAISDRGEVTLVTENRYLDKPIAGYDEIREGDYVILKVSDNGQGISATDLAKIFEPFYTKKVMGRSGTGLGLAVVWGTVKDHNGYVDVQSEEGKGSVFALYFPVTREERVGEQRKVTADFYMGRGESILVVDDVKEQRELATAMLSKLGYRVNAVPSGEEALVYLQMNRVDLLVLDMIMDPGMDGLETYQKVLEINPKQKAIIVSGFSETDRVKKAQELGAGAYVRKPYIREKIGLAIRRELDK